MANAWEIIVRRETSPNYDTLLATELFS